MKETHTTSTEENKMRCTQATLKAFGVDSCPMTGGGVMEALTANGFSVEMITLSDNGLRSCVESLKGSYYLFSDGHAMALIDGVLTDTSQRKITNRIKVVGVVKVTK